MTQSPQTEPLDFAQAGRVPEPGDNVAIAIRTLPAGTRVLIRQLVFEFAHTVLEGHRFAIYRIRKGDPLLSWGLPFGIATRDIEPGEYVCNEKILRALGDRHVPFALPASPNFLDHRLEARIDESTFKPGVHPRREGEPPAFLGFRRPDGRGAGTRNYIVVIGTSARTGALARAVAASFKEVRAQFPNVDGVVAVDHTEGGASASPLNREMTLRTLAGFIVNPNVGAVLCVDYGDEPVNNAALREYLEEHRYPIDALPCRFLSIENSFEQARALAAGQIREWLPSVNEHRRESLPASQLSLALQCGGSDAFSGVSSNPLLGLLAREVVAWGGKANLAETSELIGAESYILRNVRDLETARTFLRMTERFQKWAGWHGHSAEGNPSGGNMYRGLYNISIKSIGAGRKKDPATPLDYVIDYGQPMRAPGFYFMDSPGNDLESIAGQVAAGCNAILFSTGNGSITNFPFVPTIKVMTTTGRFELVRNEMDFNAGRYQDGEDLETLGREALEYLRQIASGQPSAGEKAGHSQVQLWREWRQDGVRGVASPVERVAPYQPKGRANGSFPVPARQSLVLPTSLCAGQVARMIAERLNTLGGARAVTLPHTEGCGNSGGESEQLFMRTMAGYLAHPLVNRALLLEHGCEKTHNDAFRNLLRDLRLPEAEFGWASVQMDGGIERVIHKAVAWFDAASAHDRANPLSIAFAGESPSAAFLERARRLAEEIVAGGGFVVVPERFELFPDQSATPTLSYGERANNLGVHRMETPTRDLVEILTGLGATGAQLLIAWENDHLVPENPLVPTLQAAQRGLLPGHLEPDVDLLLNGQESLDQWRSTIDAVLAGRVVPRSRALRNIAFQITRGYTGISL